MGEDVSSSASTKKIKKQKKRKIQDENTTEENINEPNKKKRRRRKITEHLQKETQTGAKLQNFNDFLLKELQEKLSVVEKEEMLLEEDQFLPPNENLQPLSVYLKDVIPKWSKLTSSVKHKKTNSPILLLISSSAKRAVDVNRQAADFKGKCTSVKLFAKHMKLEEQEEYLNKHKVHFGVGTPFRMISLLESKALNLRYLKYIILDWNWRDVKSKRLIDNVDVKKILVQLLSQHLIPQIKTGKTKLGLF
ncbi:protein CMSS1-like isoform X2 [Ptychodera flava]|uniref:protein CMSS1-like isoform X2 n=1 Tax=Ptychodera flava TaxID=63121 RepID=UPI00396A11BA